MAGAGLGGNRVLAQARAGGEGAGDDARLQRASDCGGDGVVVGQGLRGDEHCEFADASGRDFLRLENLDIDVSPDPEAVARTREAAGEDAANSYLPFIGSARLREAAARHVSALSGVSYSRDNVVIAAGGLSGVLNALLALVEVSDEVIVTDPTYAGLLNRVRLSGGVPVAMPFAFHPGEAWRLDRGALLEAVTSRTRAMLLVSPSMPSGGVLDEGDWALVCVQRRGCAYPKLD